jgi:hypothetical protein
LVLQKDSWAIDYQATLNTLEVAQETGAKHFVLLSAICVQKPLLEFQHAKLKFEEALQSAQGITYSIVRPTAFFKSLAGQVLSTWHWNSAERLFACCCICWHVYMTLVMHMLKLYAPVLMRACQCAVRTLHMNAYSLLLLSVLMPIYCILLDAKTATSAIGVLRNACCMALRSGDKMCITACHASVVNLHAYCNHKTCSVMLRCI